MRIIIEGGGKSRASITLISSTFTADSIKARTYLLKKVQGVVKGYHFACCVLHLCGRGYLVDAISREMVVHAKEEFQR